MFVFDRLTGEPIYPIEEIPVKSSGLDGEKSWPTQPLPTHIPPFSRQEFSKALINDMFPTARAMLAWTPNQKDKILKKSVKEVC